MLLNQTIPAWISIDIYSLAILLIICVMGNDYKFRNRKDNLIFYGMGVHVLLLLILDIASNVIPIADNTENVVAFVYAMIFILDPMFHFYAIMYMRHRINAIENKSRWYFRILSYLCIIHTLIIISMGVLKKHWFFYISTEDNLYHRGPYHNHRAIFLLLIFLSFQIYLIAKKKLIPVKYRFQILIIPVIGMICGLIQSITVLPTEYAGMILIMMIFTFFVNGRDLKIDYLTGAYNRKSLDMLVEERMAKEPDELAIIMIDLDFFKEINDTFGHDVGDEALINTCRILNSCTTDDDMVSRYGGDEFVVVVKAADDATLDAKKERIKEAFDEFNASGKTRYKLSLSVGGRRFKGFSSNMSVKEFIQAADLLMYKEKREHHARVKRL
ncbi:MAG: GGDEF domain-containing protein [Lachnospiraceae bacterium]|nr:GGDEF domain-containing protein [Lachnospiraceae bacterium]